MAKKKQEVQLIGASKLMEKVFTGGLYRELKFYENRKEQMKDQFHKIVKDSHDIRHEFHGVVAKFIRNPVYTTDQEGLLDYLENFGVLPYVTKIDAKKVKEETDIQNTLSRFAYPVKSYVRFYLNGEGRGHLDKTQYNFDMNLERLSHWFLKTKSGHDRMKNQLELYKNNMLNCPVLKQAGSLVSNYGTVKRLNYATEYDIPAIYQELGADFLKQYGSVNMEALDDYICRGILNQKEIQSFRMMTDHKLKFMVMDVESEQRAWDYFQSERIRKSNLSRNA
ncbi:hypothetical protein GLW08_21210 [Pontibacillus yanchengensis]|uniref:Uncharacterized protein n=2 Tax=Pontibacillus yanchengensis TaxID=462910 RepID=A0ACC7VM26_9BACI|nr:hypothetical protein [Pontibacillus yanchengensis]MYL35514.1 hypothetical protein [Pontibacillus yanchengensis]MYL55822.1 hypothetical protein [Pontibacillus yanchengensis]